MASLMATAPDTGNDDQYDDDDDDDHINTHSNGGSVDDTFMSRCGTGWQHPGRRWGEPKEEKC